jgi:hypothetical protein
MRIADFPVNSVRRAGAVHSNCSVRAGCFLTRRYNGSMRRGGGRSWRSEDTFPLRTWLWKQCWELNMVAQNGVERRMELLCHGGPTSCLSIGLSSFDHLSIRYIDALFLRTPMKLSFPLCWRRRKCFAGDSRNNIALLWFGEFPEYAVPPLFCTSLPLNCIPHAAWVNGTFLQLIWQTEYRCWVTEPRASCRSSWFQTFTIWKEVLNEILRRFP